MSLREDLIKYIDGLQSDTLVSISEYVNNMRVADELQTIVDKYSD